MEDHGSYSSCLNILKLINKSLFNIMTSINSVPNPRMNITLNRCIIFNNSANYCI